MIRPHEEIIDFIAAGTTPQSVAVFQASQATRDRVAELIEKEKASSLTPDEASDLDQFMQLEHLMRLVKARARTFGELPVHSKGIAP